MSSVIPAFIKITRPVNLIITAATVIVSGFIVPAGDPGILVLILAALCASLSAASGNVINDITDIRIDAVNRPDRPLPSGAMTIRQAYILFYALNLSAIIISGFVSLAVVSIVIVSQIITYYYSVRLKAVAFAGNAAVAFLTGLTVIFGGVAAGGELAYAVVPAGFAFLINLVREMVKDIEDVEGDIKNGVRTAASKYGIVFVKKTAAVLTILLLVSTIIPFLLHMYRIEYFVVVMCTVNVLLVWFLKKLFAAQDKKTYSFLSSMLKAAMVLGLVAVYLGCA